MAPTGALEIAALLVLLFVVPLLVLAILAGAAEYVRQGAEAELAELEAVARDEACDAALESRDGSTAGTSSDGDAGSDPNETDR